MDGERSSHQHEIDRSREKERFHVIIVMAFLLHNPRDISHVNMSSLGFVMPPLFGEYFKHHVLELEQSPCHYRTPNATPVARKLVMPLMPSKSFQTPEKKACRREMTNASCVRDLAPMAML